MTGKLLQVEYKRRSLRDQRCLDESFLMDRQRKKQLKRRWAEGQRAEARADLPLPFDELQAMFDMLDAELPVVSYGC